MKMEMIDLTGHGATVRGKPIVAVDVRLAHDLAICGVNGTADLAAAVTETMTGALDAADEGYPAGELFYAVACFIDPGGAGRVHIHAERIGDKSTRQERSRSNTRTGRPSRGSVPPGSRPLTWRR